MINDPQLQSDGFVSLTDGVNGNLSPNQIPDTSAAFAINVTFRNGKPCTRPGLTEIDLQNGDFDGLGKLSTEYFQGAAMYHPSDSFKPTKIVGSFGGHIVVVNLGTNVVDRLFPVMANGAYDNTFKNDPLAKAYFCQAEDFMVIQNGVDTPLIYDGTNLYQSGIGPAESPGAVSSIPIGTSMAYGQGRLFVTLPDRFSFEAGDLVYGGSTSQIGITSSSAATNSTITTSTAHGFSTGDLITITGHSSDPDLNDTWEVTVTTSTTFTIPKTVTNTGRGGFAIRVGYGKASDLLRFTEKNYLNEGGSLRVPAQAGRITGLSFMAVGNTNSGQGDLLVFCERGAVSFAVANYRDNWKSVSGFQRILFPDIGSVSDRSIIPINGDLYFRSWDGIRSYRNAVSEQGSLGYVPLSAEIRNVLQYDSFQYLPEVSSIFFDNRLFVTCSPKQDLKGTDRTLTESTPVRFQACAVYDFASITQSGGRRSAVWEGIWVLGETLQLFSGLVSEKPMAFSLNYNPVSGLNELWEVTRFGTTDKPFGSAPNKIASVLETRSFSFTSPFELKRLARGDFWLSDLSGSTDFVVRYRPDQYPCWVNWHSFTECAESSFCPSIGAFISQAITPTEHTQLLTMTQGDVEYFRLSAGTKFTIPLPFGLTEEELQNALVTAGILPSNAPSSTVTRVGDGVASSPYVYVIGFTSKQLPLLLSPSNPSGTDGTVCEALQPPDYQPQYRAQIRLPTPVDPPSENSCDPITGKPFRTGYEFQLRIRWEGYAKINKFALHAYPMVEQVGAGCP